MEDDSLLAEDTTQTFPRTTLLNLTPDASSTITPLEQEVLDEYSRLVSNMNQLSATLQTLSSGPITLEIAENLRLLERKVASVYTLMKASVYSIVLQQGQVDQTVLEGDATDADVTQSTNR